LDRNFGACDWAVGYDCGGRRFGFGFRIRLRLWFGFLFNFDYKFFNLLLYGLRSRKT
jgi:hypothetical protein